MIQNMCSRLSNRNTWRMAMGTCDLSIATFVVEIKLFVHVEPLFTLLYTVFYCVCYCGFLKLLENNGTY